MSEDQDHKDIMDVVVSIKEHLVGTLDKPGLIGKVESNTNFRKRISKILFAVLTTVVISGVMAVIVLL